MLSLFLLFHATSSDAATKKHKTQKGVQSTMRVVAVRPANDNAPYLVVTFTPSQRFYRLPNDADPKYLQILKESERTHVPVVVRRASEQSDVILSVERTK